MENTTFAMPNIIDSHDMRLRTVLQSRRPKINAYSTTFKPCLPLMISGSQGAPPVLQGSGNSFPSLFCPGSLPGKDLYTWSQGKPVSLLLVLKPFSVTIMDVCCFVVLFK
ncbi:hypothetical protein TNCV_5015581 [Trichonephila clavipes]|nr:hypothetical protein TNCV_5015581 [Trichonephila clavipes]